MRRTLAICLLVILAGCGGPAVDSDPGTPVRTATPAPVPTSQSTYPPGVTPGTLDTERLATATAQSLAEGNYTWTADRLQGIPDQSLTTSFVGPRTRIRAASSSRYVRENYTVSTRGTGLTLRRFENATYATGDRIVTYDGNTTTVRPQRQADVGRGARLAATLIARYLTAETVRVQRLPNGSARVTGRGIAREAWLDYSLRALVAADGTVLRFEAVFRANERIRLIQFRLNRSVPFEPPRWAANQTVSTPAENETTTSTATPG